MQEQKHGFRRPDSQGLANLTASYLMISEMASNRFHRTG